MSIGTLVITRKAMIFRAGKYPDKGVVITVENLDTMIDNFTPVDLRSEHDDSAFDGSLGLLRRVWRENDELWGELEFSETAWAFIEKSGARRISIAFTDDFLITELSIVSRPRVADAYIYSFNINDEVKNMENKEKAVVDVVEFNTLKTRLDAMEQEKKQLAVDNAILFAKLKSNEVNALVDGFINKGAVTPAQRDDLVNVFLGVSETPIEFGDKTVNARESLVNFLNSIKPVSFSDKTVKSDKPQEMDDITLTYAKAMGLGEDEIKKYLEVK